MRSVVMHHPQIINTRRAEKDWRWKMALEKVDGLSSDVEKDIDEGFKTDRTRVSTREEGPDGPGRM